MNSFLDYLKDKRLVWQANQHSSGLAVSSCGYAELDQALGGGLPQVGTVALNSPLGIGEIRLLLPVLSKRHQPRDKLLVFIAPPMQVNSESLAAMGLALEHILIVSPQSAKQALWSAEQCLKSGCCHTVLLWQDNLSVHQVKRLQLAAEQGEALHLLLRHSEADNLSLPVSLALQLSPDELGIKVSVTKRKGGWPSGPLSVNMQRSWPYLSKLPERDNVLPFPHSKAS